MPERSVEIRLEVVNGAQAREQILRLGDGEEALRKVGRGAQTASAGLDQVGISAERAARQASSRMVNLSAQIQDIAVSLQGGQGLLRVFIQQGSQIASIWGAAGGQIGIAVAVIGTLVSVLYNLASAQEESAAAADLLKQSNDEVNKILEMSTEEVLKNAEAFTKLTETERELIRQRGEQKIDENTASLKSQREVIQDLAAELEGLGKQLQIAQGARGPTASYLLGVTPGPETVKAVKEASEIFKQLFAVIESGRNITTDEEYRDYALALSDVANEAKNVFPAVAEIAEKLQDASGSSIEASKNIKLTAQNLLYLDASGDLTSTVEWLQQFAEKSKEAEQNIDRLLAARKREVEQRNEMLASLAIEVEQTQRLAEAQAKGADEARKVEIAIAAENAARKLGKDATDEQRLAVEQQTTSIELNKDAIKGSEQARSDAAAAAKKAANEAEQAAEQQERAAEKRRETISDLQFEVGQLELVADAERKGAEAGREAQIAMIALTAARKLGTDATEAERQAVIALTTARERETDEAKASQQAREDATKAAERARTELQREQQRAQEQTNRELERQAAEQAKAFARPFERAADSIQDTFTDVFEEIYSGGVTSFGDLADQIKRIMIRMAAEMTTLALFRPGAFGMGGGQPGAAPGAAGGASVASSLGFFGGGGIDAFGATRLGLAGQVPRFAPNGMPIVGPNGQQLTTTQTGPFGSTATLSQALGAGMLGAAGGTVVGGFFGGQGSTGGMIGGGLGAGVGMALGGPLGGLAGGALGSLGGGFLGSLFGSGGDRDTGPLRFGTGTGGTGDIFRGVFGNLRIGGEDAFGKPLADLVNQFDSGVAQFLTTRQKDRVEAALAGLDEFSGRFPEDDPSEGFAQILRTRATSILSALGLDPDKIIGGFTSTEDIASRTQQALQTQAQIQDLTAKSGDQLSKQLKAINEEFRELIDTAREYGISVKGLARAQREARQEVIAQARGQLNQGLLGIGSPFEALADPLRAFQTQIGFAQQSPAAQFKTLQADFNRLAKEARGGSLAAIGQLQGAGQALLSAAGAYGASPEIARVTTQISSVLDSVLGNLERAQDRASAGLEGAIARASRAQIDTMHELVSEQRKAVAELKSLNRALNKLPRAA